MKQYLVCFDISDDSIRRRVGNTLEAYGDRVQYSVFEIVVKRNSDLKQLKTTLEDLLEPNDDLRFYSLSRDTRRKSFPCNNKALKHFPAAIVI